MQYNYQMNNKKRNKNKIIKKIKKDKIKKFNN